MKITSNRKQFSDSFQIAAAVAATRDVKPILQNVKLTAKKDEVLLQSTDTEIGIRISLDFPEVSKNGEAILHSKKLRQILQESISDDLAIESSKDKVTVSGIGGSETWAFDTQPVDEFPNIEEFEENVYYEVPAAVLKTLIRRTTFATDNDSTRYALGGVLLEFADKKVTAVATDGRRMSVQEGGAEKTGDRKADKSEKSEKAPQTILPKRSLDLVEKALDNDDESVKIAVSENRVLFQYKNVTFFSRLLEGRFPKWRDVIPATEDKITLEILAGTLKSAVKRAAIAASERSPGVIFTIKNGEIELRADESEDGTSDISVPVAYEGEEFKIKFDPKYLVDYLNVFESEKNITLYFSKDDPLLAKTDDSHQYVVMPINMS
ncbi:DNA polymerase III subunit beta [Planctomycetales bacterium]|nr:DNA polymerase III subunit beta [Planctomycetales bacterium]